MTSNNTGYKGLRTVERRDFFNILSDLPRLPEGAKIIRPYSDSNPVAIDEKTGIYYKLNRQTECWEIADK